MDPASKEQYELIQTKLKKTDAIERAQIKETETSKEKSRTTLFTKRGETVDQIPNFWLRVFLGHPKLRHFLNRYDREIFGYLSSIEAEKLDPQKLQEGLVGETIVFTFKSNPYFTNQQLTKTFITNEVEKETKEVIATEIHWRDGRAMPDDPEAMKNRLNQARPYLSFFNWFRSTKKDTELDIDDEFATIIKDKLLPNPLKYLYDEDPAEDNIAQENPARDNRPPVREVYTRRRSRGG